MYDFNMKPFRFWCQKVLPLVYDDSLSYYEVLCKIITYLNHVIEDVNQIPEYIRSMLSDEKLKEILSGLLDELREQIASANEGTSETATADRNKDTLVWLNGELYICTRDILSGDRYVVATGGSTGNVQKITFEELLRSIEEKLSNADTVLQENINAEAQARESADGTLQHNIDAEAQARESADGTLQNNIDAEVQARESADGTLQNNIDKVKNILQTDLLFKRKFSFVDDYGTQFIAWTGNGYLLFNDNTSDNKIEMTELTSSFYYVRRTFINTTGHPNGGGYRDGKVYIANNSGTDVIVIDATNGDIIKRIELGETVIGGCAYGDNIYISTDGITGQNLYEIDKNDNVTLQGLYKYSLVTGEVVQNVCVDANNVYLLFNRPNFIMRYDKETHQLIKTYEFGEGDGYFPFGEPESLTCIDEKIYLATALSNNSGRVVTELFETSLNNLEFVPRDLSGYGLPLHVPVYVDSSANNNNPNGLASNAFNNLTEASMFLNYNYGNNMYIGLDVTGTFVDSIVLHECNVEIIGHSATIRHLALYDCTAFIKGLTTTAISELRQTKALLRSLTGETINNTYSEITAIDVTNNIACGDAKIEGIKYNISALGNSYVPKIQTYQSGLSFTGTSCTINIPANVQNMLRYKKGCSILISVLHVDSVGLHTNPIQLLLNDSNVTDIVNSSATYIVSKVFTVGTVTVRFNIKLIISLTGIEISVLSHENLTDNTAVTIPTFYAGIVKYDF